MRDSYFHEGSKLALATKAFDLSEAALDTVWALQLLEEGKVNKYLAK
jgi:hypothetical protein